MPEILSHWNTAMQQPTDHFSTGACSSAAGSPATASLIQQAQPSAATAAASAPGTSEPAADNNGHDYKTVSEFIQCSTHYVNYVQPTMQDLAYAGALNYPGNFS